MAEISFGTMGGIRPQASAKATARESQPVMRILLIGEFSARKRSAAERGAAKAVLVDRDNLDEVIAQHKVELAQLVTGEGIPPATIAIRSMEDFHPDTLFNSLEIFASLRALRRRLSNPTSFAAAAEEVRAWGRKSAKPSEKPSTAKEPPAPAADPDAPEQNAAYSVEGLFDLTLGATDQAAVAAPKSQDDAADWNAMIQNIAAPYALANTAAQEAEFIAVVDEVIGETMRTILHHERFRAVEMAWRSVELLVRRLTTDATLKLYVLDLAPGELAADLMAGDDLTRSLLYKRLVDETVNTPGGKPWGATLVLHQFQASGDDIALLGRLAQIAAASTAPIIAGIHERIAGCASLATTPDVNEWNAAPPAEVQAAWKALRELSASAYLGLALPRLLIRLPYGSKFNPTEKFKFEELPESLDDRARRHDHFAWAAAATACGALLGESFSADGWQMDLADRLDLDELPMLVDRVDGELEAVPCAEALLTDRAVERLMNLGLMPLISFRETDRVRLGGFRSIRGSHEPLAGRWQ
jgi:type VI secretion system protein ImpC